MNITRLHLRVPDGTHLEAFYSGLLGMQYLGNPKRPVFGYNELQCLIEFSIDPDMKLQFSDRDFYWKTGITVRNLRHAVDFLHLNGWKVSQPRQFRDIGYLCHLNDPNGLPIELLQQGFEGNEMPVGEGHPIGGQATVAHITLRVTDIIAARSFFEGALGMRLMSIQPVPEREFTLYFFAWSEDELPCPDLKDPRNREWLWARPYALLELKHMQASAEKTRWPEVKNSIFGGFSWHSNVTRKTEITSIVELISKLRR